MSDSPALLGGDPVRSAFATWPNDPAIAAAVAQAFVDGSWNAYRGPAVARLESTLAERWQVAHAMTCASGTLAVEIALRAVGVGAGDAVALAAYEYEPTFVTLHELGARPILVDVDPVTLALDYPAVPEGVRAIVATHLHGGLAPMARIMAFAAARGIAVVEDAAQACGATIDGKPAGSWGTVGTLSFGGSKLVSAGRGGALLVNDATLFARARRLLTRGIQELAPLSELQAVAILPQLDRLTEHHRARLEAMTTIRGQTPNDSPAYYKAAFRLDSSYGLDRATVCAAMCAEGIALDPGFKPLHIGRSPKRFTAAGPLPHAEQLGRELMLLHHPILAEGVAGGQAVAEALSKTYRNAQRLRSTSTKDRP